MTDIKQNTILLNAVRTIGIIKPDFNPTSKQFDSPHLEIFGTGFWLNNGQFITCAHVVQNIINQHISVVGMLVVGGNTKPYRKAVINMLDFEHDLAVLTIESNNQEDLALIKNEMAENGLEIFDGSLNVGDEIAYAGFPGGMSLLNEKHSPTYAEGVIGNEVIDQKNGAKTIQISGFVIGGYSGAPIVIRDDYKKVVGIVSHSPSAEIGQAGIFKGVHWKHLKALSDLSLS